MTIKKVQLFNFRCKDLQDQFLNKITCYRHPCLATELIMFYFCLFIFYFFIHRSFSETTRPILTKFSGIVYSGVVWIIR